MLYESTPNNMIAMVRSVGYVGRDQLVRFFSDVADSVRIEYYIKQLGKSRLFDIDEAKNIISWHMGPKINEREIKRRIRAFWVIASSFRSEGIRDVTLLPYPSQFMFVTHKNEVYDLTVLSSKEEATVAQRKHSMWKIDGVEDDVNHIVIVDSEALGKSLDAYGFDSYCVLDRSYKPKYGTWT